MTFREKIRVIMAASAALIFTSASGCANHFAQHYVPVETAPKRTLEAGRDCTTPELIRTLDAAAESRRLSTSGFQLIGSSNFESPEFDNPGGEALAHAKQVGADVVVLQESHAGTKTLSVPIEYPQTSSERRQCQSIPGKGAYTPLGTPYQGDCHRKLTTMLIHVESKNYCATFWRKPPITDAEHKQCSSDGFTSSISCAKRPVAGESQPTYADPR